MEFFDRDANARSEPNAIDQLRVLMTSLQLFGC